MGKWLYRENFKKKSEKKIRKKFWEKIRKKNSAKITEKDIWMIVEKFLNGLFPKSNLLRYLVSILIPKVCSI